MQASLAESICHARNTPRQLSVIADMTYEIVRQADAAMVCSGTATVETALLGCPMAIVYKLNPASYHLLKSMIRIPNIGMVNVVAGREICPELVQGKATPANLATALEPLITQTPVRTAMLKELRLFREQMGEGGAAARAATILVRMLDR
jgi:lipid-A-disaccharide synthase